jgi:hypothetical protein
VTALGSRAIPFFHHTSPLLGGTSGTGGTTEPIGRLGWDQQAGPVVLTRMRGIFSSQDRGTSPRYHQSHQAVPPPTAMIPCSPPGTTGTPQEPRQPQESKSNCKGRLG